MGGWKKALYALGLTGLMGLLSGCVLDPVYGGYPGGQYPTYPSGGYYPPDQGYPDYGNAYGGRFRCESIDNRERYCRADTRGGVQLVRQLSKTPCIRGRTWDYDRNGVWVSHGCRAEFQAGYGGGYSPGQGQAIRCESVDNRQRYCRVDTRGSVQLVRQLSKTRCIQGVNWGWDRNGIWVDRGCRAEFRVY